MMRGTDRCLSVNEKGKRWGMLMKKKDHKPVCRYCLILLLVCVLCLNGCGKTKEGEEASVNEEVRNSGIPSEELSKSTQEEVTGESSTEEAEDEIESSAEEAEDEIDSGAEKAEDDIDSSTEKTEGAAESTEEKAQGDGADPQDDGIRVLEIQDDGEYERVQYPDIDTFLREYGCEDEKPFYEYFDQDGYLQMVFYYDEQTELGLGIRYYKKDPSMFEPSGAYGFVWRGIMEKAWDGLEIDYFSPTSVFGDDASSYNDIENYQEHYEYDEDGKIIHFDAQGVITYLGDVDEISTLLRIDYVYREDGSLMYRAYAHNSFVFSTSCSTVESYFDEQERLIYEDQYITHGSVDSYYIYENEDDAPEYCLVLDFNVGDWYPLFIKYD